GVARLARGSDLPLHQQEERAVHARRRGLALGPPRVPPRPDRPGIEATGGGGLEREPRLPCTGAGAPSPLRFGAAGHGSGSDRPVRRPIGAPTAPPLPCCAVTDRGFPVRPARGLRRRDVQRPQPAPVPGRPGDGPFLAPLLTPRNTKR